MTSNFHSGAVSTGTEVMDRYSHTFTVQENYYKVLKKNEIKLNTKTGPIIIIIINKPSLLFTTTKSNKFFALIIIY